MPSDLAPDLKPWGNPRNRLAGDWCMPAWPIPAGSLGKSKIWCSGRVVRALLAPAELVFGPGRQG